MELQDFLKKLQSDGPKAPLAKLCALQIDHILAQPIEAFIIPSKLLEYLTVYFTGQAMESALETRIKPLLERALLRAEENDEIVGDWVPEEVAKNFEEMLAEPVKLDPEAVRKAVDGEAIKGTLTAVVQEAFARIAKSGSTTSGVVGLLGRSAGKLRNAGKGLLGGLGDEIERQIQKRAKDVLDSSMSALQARLVERVLSEDSARAMGNARAKFFRDFLRKKTAEAKQLPLEKSLEQVPLLLRHNLQREELREGLLVDINEILKVEGKKPLGEILTETGLLEKTRTDLQEQILPIAKKFVQSKEFIEWIEEIWE